MNNIGFILLLAILFFFSAAAAAGEGAAVAAGCGLAIGTINGPGTNGNGGVSAEKRKVDLSNLPSSCDGEADTVTVTLPNGNVKTFTKTASVNDVVVVKPPGKAHWRGEATSDGSSFEYIRNNDSNGNNGVIFGSLVDITTDTVSQFGADADGQPIVTITPTSEFPNEGDPIDDRRRRILNGGDVSSMIVESSPPSSFLRLRGSKSSTILTTTTTTTTTKATTLGYNEMINGELYGTTDLDDGRRLVLDDLGGNIDVMVIWTKKAECRNSGLDAACTVTATTEANMRSRIDLAVTETNTAYDLSGIQTQLVLVHAYRDPNYVEASSDAFGVALSALQSTTDGVMDDVHTKRLQYGADVVAMIIDDPQYCGLGYVGPYKEYMFSVTAWNCATGYYSFGHEIGHNFGCYHDKGTENECSLTSYRYGYRDPQARFRSILAYNCVTGQCDNMPSNGCTRVQRFSNPTFGYNGNPIGTLQIDNARRINDVRAIVAGYVPHVGECSVDADCDDGLFCNGAETCNAGFCQSGTPPSCDDGQFCNGIETCDEDSDACVNGTPPVCDDGLFCNGVETCNESTNSCMAGTPPVCDDGLFCNGVETCDEALDSCVAGTPPTCTSSNLCDGPGTCNTDLDQCEYISPVVCSDSVCGKLQVCNSGTGLCEDVGTGEDGVCDIDAGETCSVCPNDCTATFGGIVCGNGVCEPGEDCNNCPSDCNGITSGPRSGRFCCIGALQPNLCGDSRCNTNGFTCGGGAPAQTSCCGDGTCQPETENYITCPWDCTTTPSPTTSTTLAPTPSRTEGCPVCSVTGIPCCGTCIDGGNPKGRGCF